MGGGGGGGGGSCKNEENLGSCPAKENSQVGKSAPPVHMTAKNALGWLRTKPCRTTKAIVSDLPNFMHSRTIRFSGIRSRSAIIPRCIVFSSHIHLRLFFVQCS